jgi:hypothetical protein
MRFKYHLKQGRLRLRSCPNSSGQSAHLRLDMHVVQAGHHEQLLRVLHATATNFVTSSGRINAHDCMLQALHFSHTFLLAVRKCGSIALQWLQNADPKSTTTCAQKQLCSRSRWQA